MLPNCVLPGKGVGRKFSRGRGATEKRPKISKQYRKIALFSLLQGGQRKKDRKIAKKAENGTIKPLCTMFVPCLKIQGGARPPPLLPTPMLSGFVPGHLTMCVKR